MLETMKAMVQERGTCVLATASEGKPHCSLMTYVANDNCQEIYMVTQKNTKKYKNLMDNPHVSLLIDNRAQQAESGQGSA